MQIIVEFFSHVPSAKTHVKHRHRQTSPSLRFRWMNAVALAEIALTELSNQLEIKIIYWIHA